MLKMTNGPTFSVKEVSCSEPVPGEDGSVVKFYALNSHASMQKNGARIVKMHGVN